MSTKTIYKRIALVAVAALGAGVLSVAPANAAIQADDFNIATAAGINACVVDTTNDYAYVPTTSAGISITTGGTDDETAYVRVSGPAVISSVTAGGGAITEVSPTELDITDVDASDSAFVVKPTGVGTVKVTYATSSTTAVLDQITLYVVAACGGGVVSIADSYYTVVNSTEAAEASAGDWVDTVINTAGASTVADAGKGYVKIKLVDEYASSLASGALISTVTGPCLVGLAANNGSLVAGKGTTAVLSATGANHVAIVEQKTAGVGGSCAVTTTFNGTTIGTQTFTMQGAPATVEVSDVTVGATGGLGYYRTTVKDAAGNLLPGKVISASSTEANNAAALASGIIDAVQSNTGAATSSTAGSAYGKTQSVTASNVTTATSGANGLTRFSCVASKGGTAKLTVRTPVDSAATSYVTSAPFTVACGGALATWTVSMDKAVYAPGEIATLTLSGKDSNGFAVSTFTLLSGVVASLGGMTAVTAPTDNDAFSSGVGIKTYQYSVGTSEGAFVGTFKTTGTTDTAAKTIQYKVANATGTVSNADVLKAIVSLIASINKQIAALQKALLRR